MDILGKGRLGVIGAGVMGLAIIKGLIETETLQPDQIWAAAKTETTCKKVRQQLGISAYTDYREALADTEILLLCVKPSHMESVLDTLHNAHLPTSTLIISVVAGISLKALEKRLGQPNPVIRAMPNTPCIVGQGMTILCGGSEADQEEVDKAHHVFGLVGQTMELEESHFDAVTGLCGSGPAYLYLIMEALADGGVRVGLPREMALKIVSQVVLGAAAMVQQTGQHPAALRDDVTTPAGCTIAGLLIMEDGKIRSVLSRAVEEATKTASELGLNKLK